jgi:hypothetical protein
MPDQNARQTAGYALFQVPMACIELYENKMLVHHAWPHYERLLAALESLPRAGYRGISRFPLTALPSADPKILRCFEDIGGDMHTNYDARLRFFELLGDVSPENDADDDLLPDYLAAADVYGRLESRDEYEIVQLVRDSFRDVPNSLGFDVGYWGGDHYSIVCDSAVRPLWHPPQAECFDELARQLSVVNDHFLFATFQDAARFRSWYVTQEWAESESRSGEFCIIQLIEPKHRLDFPK